MPLLYVELSMIRIRSRYFLLIMKYLRKRIMDAETYKSVIETQIPNALNQESMILLIVAKKDKKYSISMFGSPLVESKLGSIVNQQPSSIQMGMESWWIEMDDRFSDFVCNKTIAMHQILNHSEKRNLKTLNQHDYLMSSRFNQIIELMSKTSIAGNSHISSSNSSPAKSGYANSATAAWNKSLRRANSGIFRVGSVKKKSSKSGLSSLTDPSSADYANDLNSFVIEEEDENGCNESLYNGIGNS